MLYKDQLLTSPHHCMATQSEALLLDGSCSNALWDSFLQMIHVNHSDLTVYGRKEQYCCVLICWNQSLLMTKLRSYSSVQENWSHFVVIKIQNKVMNRNQRGKYCTRQTHLYFRNHHISFSMCTERFRHRRKKTSHVKQPSYHKLNDLLCTNTADHRLIIWQRDERLTEKRHNYTLPSVTAGIKRTTEGQKHTMWRFSSKRGENTTPKKKKAAQGQNGDFQTNLQSFPSLLKAELPPGAAGNLLERHLPASCS